MILLLSMKKSNKNICRRIKNILFIILCMGGVGLNATGCSGSEETNAHNWIVPLDSKDPVIKKRVDDVGFKFCLLNEDSISSNKFNKGEDTYFYLAIENYSKEEITIDGKFAENLFLVYDMDNNVLIGTPYTGIWCEFSGKTRVIAINRKKTKEFLLYWSSPPNFGSLGKSATYPFCVSQQPLLEKGTYSCRFEMDLQYRVGGTTRDGFGFLTDGKEKRLSELFFEVDFIVE